MDADERDAIPHLSNEELCSHYAAKCHWHEERETLPYRNEILSRLSELQSLRQEVQRLREIERLAQNAYDKGYEIPQKMDTPYFSMWLSDVLKLRDALANTGKE